MKTQKIISDGNILRSMICIIALTASVSATLPPPSFITAALNSYLENIFARLAIIDGLDIDTDITQLGTISMASRLNAIDGGIDISSGGSPAVYSSTLGLEPVLVDQIKKNKDDIAALTTRLDNIDGGSPAQASLVSALPLSTNDSLWLEVIKLRNRVAFLDGNPSNDSGSNYDLTLTNDDSANLWKVVSGLSSRLTNVDGGSSADANFDSSPLTSSNSIWSLLNNVITVSLPAKSDSSALDALSTRVNYLDGGSSNSGTLNGLTLNAAADSNLWHSVGAILIRLNTIDGGSALNGDLNDNANSMYQQLKNIAASSGSGSGSLSTTTFNNYLASLPKYTFTKVLPNQWINSGNASNLNKSGDERCMVYFQTDFVMVATSKAYITLGKGVIVTNGSNFIYPMQPFTSLYDCTCPTCSGKKCLQINVKSEYSGSSNCLTSAIANANNVRLNASVMVVNDP